MKYTVERIEDNVVVLEDENGNLLEVSLRLLPENIKSGNILLFENNSYNLINTADEERRKRIKEKYQQLFDKNMKNF